MVLKEQRVVLTCDFCASSSKPGYLWLGGKDYVECPQCFERGRFEIVEQVFTPAKLFIPPQRSLLKVGA